MEKEQGNTSAFKNTRAFHDQLRRLIAARIPVCLENGKGIAFLRDVDRIGAQLESYANGHGDLSGYEADDTLPKVYRNALGLWLQGDRIDALNRLAAGAEGQRFFKNAFGFVLMQASLIIGFLFLGMVSVCLWLLPKVEAIQSESFVEPGIGLLVLKIVATTLPYWGSCFVGGTILAFYFREVIFRHLMSCIAPIHETSFALSEFQGFFSRPVRFQRWVVGAVAFCGFLVLLQALSILGVTFELLTQLVSP